jgi:hypothetical protein
MNEDVYPSLLYMDEVLGKMRDENFVKIFTSKNADMRSMKMYALMFA